ncbi:MAG TPA: hypothetical protein VGI40_06285 [Pirellulaceae bacterium]
MANTIVVKGRLINPTTVELESPVEIPTGDARVDVLLPARDLSYEARSQKAKELIKHLMSLPPGRRTIEDIDRQIQEERDSWE